MSSLVAMQYESKEIRHFLKPKLASNIMSLCAIKEPEICIIT